MSGEPSGTSVTDATPDGIPADHTPRPFGADRAGSPDGSDGPVPERPGSAPAWRSWAVGTRVVVRRRLPEGGWTDVLGELDAVGPDGVVVVTRRGPVHVPAPDIALGKPVPPAPARRPGRAAGASPT